MQKRQRQLHRPPAGGSEGGGAGGCEGGVTWFPSINTRPLTCWVKHSFRSAARVGVNTQRTLSIKGYSLEGGLGCRQARGAPGTPTRTHTVLTAVSTPLQHNSDINTHR